MSMDVSKDPRILMAEYAVYRLKELTINKKYKLPASKEKTMEAIEKVRSVIKNIKYSYIAPKELVENKAVKELELMADQFLEAIARADKNIDKHDIIYSELRFIFRILKKLKDRLKLGNDASLDKAVDIVAAKVLTVNKIPKKENLFICRVGEGERILNVITNLKDIKKDIVVPIAILPPRAFGEVISEAMFCGSEDLPDMHDKVGERVLSIPEKSLKEVGHFVMEALKSIK
ncbi:MAG: hypothetical protein ACTSPQ_12990 [Candidatus Helarchaeota archaeon]